MNENISEIVRNKIEKTDYGIVFSGSDFPVEVTKQKSVNKVLENLTKLDVCQKGDIIKPK